MNRKIKLTFRKEDFEEVYFKDDNGNIFNGQLSAKPLKILLIIILLYIITYLVSYYLDNLEFVLFASVFVLIFTFSYVISVYNSWEWKKEVNAYISSVEKVKSSELEVTENGISLKQDENISVLKWTSFTKVNIESNIIWLLGDTNLMLPQKSMSLENYAFLKFEIQRRILDSTNQKSEEQL